MKPTQWCDFVWDPDIFPDPEGLLKKIHDKGIKVCVWINPYIAQKSRLFEEGMKNGYFIKKYGNGISGKLVWPLLTLLTLTQLSGIKAI